MKGRDRETDKPPRSQDRGWPAATWKLPGCPRPQLRRPSKQPQGRRGAAAGGGELDLRVTEGQGGSWKLWGDQGWFRDPGSETVDSAAGLSSQGGGAEKTILGP